MPTFLVRDADGARLQLDVVSSFVVRPRYTVPRHPIEKGARVVDHIHPDPITVDLSVRFTSNPLPDQEGQEGWARVSYASEFLRSTNLLEPPTVYIEADDPKIDELEDLVIQSAPERSDMLSGREVDLVLTQVRFASVGQIAVPDRVVTSRGKKKEGNNGTDEMKDEDISFVRRTMNTLGATPGSPL